MTKDCTILPQLQDEVPLTPPPFGTPLSQISKSSSPLLVDSSSTSSSSSSPSRISPRSPLDCGCDDVLMTGGGGGCRHTTLPPLAAEKHNNSSSNIKKKSILHLEGGGPGTASAAAAAGVISCSPPTVHIEDEAKATTAKTTTLTNPGIPTPKKKKVVSFSKRIMFREIKHLQDYTTTEIEDLWLTPTDYQFNKAVVKSTVLKIMKGEIISEDDVDFSSRGLEYRTRHGARTRNRNKLKTRSAVLNEQEMQFDEGFYDPTFIGMVSEEASQECRTLAFERAKWDELCIQDYLKDTPRTF